MNPGWTRRNETPASQIASAIGGALGLIVALALVFGWLVVIAAIVKAAWRYLTLGGF